MPKQNDANVLNSNEGHKIEKKKRRKIIYLVPLLT